MDRTAARAEEWLYSIAKNYRRPEMDHDDMESLRALLDIAEVCALSIADERRIRKCRNTERATTEPEPARTPLIAA
jgi:hypothetical protein